MGTSVMGAAGLLAAPGHVTGRSPAIQSVNSVLPEIARTSIPVLLVGESGTGKEVYARCIHRLSRKSPAPLVKVSCRAREAEEFLAELKTLLREDGAKERSGFGTLFLDGIDELDSSCQKVLLSQLPEAEAESIENDGPRRIATATRNLDEEVERGLFRPELYFRMNGVCLRLPPLRARSEDVQELMEHFLAKHAQQQERDVPTLADEEKAFFRTYDWPGNIRELENVARKIVLFADPRAVIAELRMPAAGRRSPSETRNHSLKVVARAASRQAERAMIKEALERTHWNRKQAAKDLRVSYKSLLYKIKETGLEAKPLDQE